VPSFLAQSRLEAGVYRRSRVDVESIQYIEAHGTGTKLGDPVEIHALNHAFAQFTNRKKFCAIGSVKANIGHTTAAAGVRIQTVGVGTAKGGVVEVDGYQLGTALDETLLTGVAQVTGGAYHQAGDAGALADTTKSIDLRLTSKKEPIELTAPFAGAALLLLALGAFLGARWHGRFI